MHYQNKKEAIISILKNFIQGLFVGFISVLPFMNTKNIEKFTLKEEVKGFNNYFSKTLPYIIAIGISAALTFYSPFSMLIEKYHGGIYIGLLLFVVLFLIQSLYEFMKTDRKNKKDLLFSGIVFLAVFTFCFGFSFASFKTPENTLILPFIIMLILAVGTYACLFSGISPSTLFFFTGIFFICSDYLKSTLYQGFGNNLLLIVCFILGIFIGSSIYRYTEKFIGERKQQRITCNIAIYFAGALTIAIHNIKEPFFFESTTITPLAQAITMFCTIFCFALVGVILTFPTYPFFQESFHFKPSKGHIRRR